jgi:hypothetical protein
MGEVMRALRTMALAVGLLIGPTLIVVAQDAADKPVGFGGRVVVPEAGFAVTLPDDSVFLRPHAAYDASLLGEAESRVEPLLSATAEEYEGFGGNPVMLISWRMTESSVTEEICSVRTGSTHGKSAEFIAGMRLATMRDWDWPVDLTLHELPVGETASIYYDDRPTVPVTAGAHWLFVDGETLHELTCMGDDRNEDGWLSIAEAFEFLPAD